MQPSSGSNAVDTPVQIFGRDFNPKVFASYDDESRSKIETDFSARLGTHPLVDVSYISSLELSAVVPAGLPPGMYDLTVVDPLGREGTLPAAFQVLGEAPLDAGVDAAADAGGDAVADVLTSDAPLPDLPGEGGLEDAAQPDLSPQDLLADIPPDALADAGLLDGPADAGLLDAPADAGLLDGPADAGLLDAPADAGPLDAPVDAGLLDAPADAGLLDVPADAGQADMLVDGGLPDAFYIDTSTGCPAVCANNCAGGVCQLDCKQNCACPAGWDCQIPCPNNGVCKGNIDCSQAKSCSINCSSGSCTGHIVCGTGNCNVSCVKTSCTGNITCEGSCTVICSDGSCTGSVICSGGPCTISCPSDQGATCREVDCSSACSCSAFCGPGSCWDGLLCPAGCDQGSQCVTTPAAQCDTC